MMRTDLFLFSDPFCLFLFISWCRSYATVSRLFPLKLCVFRFMREVAPVAFRPLHLACAVLVAATTWLWSVSSRHSRRGEWAKDDASHSDEKRKTSFTSGEVTAVAETLLRGDADTKSSWFSSGWVWGSVWVIWCINVTPNTTDE